MTEEEHTQEFHKLPAPTGEGEDDHGPFQIIPLSMVRGGRTKPFKVYTDPLRHLTLDQVIQPRGWYKAKHEAPRRRPRPCYTEAILTNPYGGFCPVACAYCYVNNGTRGYRATGLPTVDPEYPEKMAKRIKQMMVSGAFYISSFTEPFHRLESTYHITQRLTDVILKEGLPLFYLSKRVPPEWAIDALQENPYSYMQWSINTSNAEHYKKMGPGTSDLDEIYDYIYDMSDSTYISIQCNPIIAGVTTLKEIVQLVEDVSSAGAHHIIFKFVEQVANNRKVVVERLHDRKLPRVDIFDNLFSQVIGGVYTIEEEVRIEWLDTLLLETRKAGMTMSTCYEYYDNGKAGDNLAPFYTTADQCHGRGVPIYFRPETEAPWEPLAGCYRKGCLYCEEYGTKACHDETLLQAKALTPKDLKTIWLERNLESDWETPESCIHPTLAYRYIDVAPYGNANMETDAEMWGWELEDEE